MTASGQMKAAGLQSLLQDKRGDAMGTGGLLILAFGLAADAFSVSVCKGLAVKKNTLRTGLLCGIWFGLFQAAMPLAGFLLGSTFAEYIEKLILN